MVHGLNEREGEEGVVKVGGTTALLTSSLCKVHLQQAEFHSYRVLLKCTITI